MGSKVTGDRQPSAHTTAHRGLSRTLSAFSILGKFGERKIEREWGGVDMCMLVIIAGTIELTCFDLVGIA